MMHIRYSRSGHLPQPCDPEGMLWGRPSTRISPDGHSAEIMLARTAENCPIPLRDTLVAGRLVPQKQLPLGLVAAPGIGPMYPRQGGPTICPLAAEHGKPCAADRSAQSLPPPQARCSDDANQHEHEHGFPCSAARGHMV